MGCPEPMLRGVPSDQWNPACWEWPIPDLSDLDNSDPFDETGEVMQVLRKWHADRCAMDGNVHDELVTDHDKRTAIVRGLLCRSCNRLEASHSDDQPLGRYRQRCPTDILGLTIRYWDPFNGFVEPEEEHDEEELMRRAKEIVNGIHIEDPFDTQSPDPED
jgi:hypothetical protein